MAAGDDDLSTRVERLERRLAEAEDRLAILEVIATYGPAVDSGAAGVVASLWAEDGTYDSTPAYPVVMEGRDALETMVNSDQHQSYIANGCGHLLGLPHITIEGDRAVAICHSQLLLRNKDQDSFRIWRLTANRWELIRVDGRWQVQSRLNRLLDGSEGGPALFRDGVTPPGAASGDRIG